MYLKIAKARKNYECFECPEPINIGEKYISLSTKVTEKRFWTSKFHYHCFCAKVLQLMYFRKEKTRKPYPQRVGRPRVFIEADMKAVDGKWEKFPLTTIQKKSRAILTVQFHRAKELGRDISAIKSEMERLGGIPKSWQS